MLPVTHGDAYTRRHILLYSLALVPIALAPAFTPVGGVVYFSVSLVLNVLFVLGAVRLWRRVETAAIADRFRAEKQFFGFSILYLFLHFAALLLEAGLRAAGLGLAAWPSIPGLGL